MFRLPLFAFSFDLSGVERVVASITGLLVAAGALAKWYLPIREERRKRSGILEGFRSLRVIYGSFERAAEIGAQRIILFGGHDGGGLPRAGAPFHISPYHWKTSQLKPINVEDFQDLELDESYISMLLDIERVPFYRYDLTKTESLLGSIYAAEGIIDSIIIFLTVHNNIYFWISYCSYDRKFTQNEITSLVLISSSIAREIKKG